MSVDYKKQLERQLGFIRRSCSLYDQGFEDEAIRISTTIRVLMHDTPKSTSLLKHLDKKDINIFSQSSSIILGGEVFFLNMGLIKSGRFVANLSEGALQRRIPLDEWWNQTAFILDDTLKLSKRDIVLTAANKDGGAHVDSHVPPAYEALINFGNESSFTTSMGIYDKEKIINAHFTALRQMGYELLNSPELIGIVN